MRARYMKTSVMRIRMTRTSAKKVRDERDERMKMAKDQPLRVISQIQGNDSGESDQRCEYVDSWRYLGHSKQCNLLKIWDAGGLKGVRKVC
jgi:hypothetical protein